MPPSSGERNLPSLLPLAYRRLLVLALALAAFMLANAFYLLINRWADLAGLAFLATGGTLLPKFYQLMVLTHTGVGLLLAALMVSFLLMHLPVVWKRHRRYSVVSGVLFVAAGLLLLVTGLFILTEAASRDNRWAWWVHVVCAALIPVGYAVHRLVAYSRPRSVVRRRFAAIVGAGLLVLLAVHGITVRDAPRTAGLQTARTEPRLPDSAFIPAGFVSPGSPFFPSAATTSSNDYMPSRIITRQVTALEQEVKDEIAQYSNVRETLIGAETCERCHQDIVAQWATSAHRFASFNNPFYEATVNDLRRNSSQSNTWIEEHMRRFPVAADASGKVKSKWCSGCHDPALMLSGRMSQEIDRTSIEAQAGLTCLACHAIDRIHDRTGNGNYNIADEQEDPYLFADKAGGTIGAFLHDAALKAKPTVHKRQMLRSFFRESEYCATCHKVSLSEPVNNYRWLRGQNEFDNWDDSGVSLNASRTFYLPETRRVCQDCHMPLESAPLGDVAAKNGRVKSHRFLAVNTALPYVRDDTATLQRIEEFLRDRKMNVDIFAVTQGQRSTVMEIDRHRPVLMPGSRVTVDVVVRNLGVGHTFPGGTNDSNEGWLEFSVIDSSGNILAVSGIIDAENHLDGEAHVYKVVLVDKNGERIARRNAQDIYVTVFTNVVNPGTADVVHYEFTLPEWVDGDSMTFRARLLWRKFDREYTEFAFHSNRQGFGNFSEPPELPITEIAADTVSLSIGSASHADEGSPPARDDGTWVRYNDYGIGSLMEGNTRMAAAAFSEVKRLAPGRIDGPLNLAKTAIQDGNIAAAYEYLLQSEAIMPGHAQAAWVWGIVLQEDGRYDEAVMAYQRVLQEFPGDRAAWRNMGRSYYLNGQYEEALETFDKVLAIDPEDRISHYHRMLCFQAMGRSSEAQAAAAAYEYYSIDESAQEVTRSYRLRNPGANLMAQSIRTHTVVLEQPAHRAREH